ncbi:hypothetical protein PT2222_370054 [Paraburkholderia tropica]
MAGLLACGSRFSCPPSRFPSGAEWHELAAYSCGGSRRLDARRRHCVPF